MEEFQGDERKVILVSAVRSNAQIDQKFSLGFVKDDKVRNTAHTYAHNLTGHTSGSCAKEGMEEL